MDPINDPKNFFFVLTIKMTKFLKKSNFFFDFYRDFNRKSYFSQKLSIFRGSRYHIRKWFIKSNKKKRKSLRFIVRATLTLFYRKVGPKLTFDFENTGNPVEMILRERYNY